MTKKNRDEGTRRLRTLRAVNGQLRDALKDLQNYQQALGQARWIEALGQLTSGIAHELNTPLGAITSAAGSIAHYLRHELPETLRFWTGLTAQQREWFGVIVDRGLAGESADSFGASRIQQQRILRTALEGRSLPLDPPMVDLLVDLHLPGIADDFPDLLVDPLGPGLLTRAQAFLSAIRLSEVVAEAGEKSSHVVSSWQRALGTVEPEPLVTVDVDGGLEAALARVRRRLARVTVKRTLSGVHVRGNSQALGRVWAHLLNNALQAMDHQGHLEVASRVEGGQALVQIIDSGPGISPAVQGRIFEPFFSTKKPGQGIGLGLHLCQKIVTGHHGTIDFESRPGYTCFSVRLPAA